MKIEYIGKCLLVSAKREKILAAGDLHLGYEEVLNQSGVFVTREMFKEIISYFDRVFSKIGQVDKIVLLGDVKHDFGHILKQEWTDVLRLFDYLEGKLKRDGKIIIAKGNHDIILEPIVRKRDRVEIADYYIFNEIAFLHGDKDFKEIYEKRIKYWVVGHGHPAVKLSDNVKVEKYKCFLIGYFKGKRIVVVPSFFEYSEGSDPRESDFGMAWKFDFDEFDVGAVDSEDLKVLDFGKLGKLR